MKKPDMKKTLAALNKTLAGLQPKQQAAMRKHLAALANQLDAALAGAFSVGIIWSMVMTLVVIPALYGVVMNKIPTTPNTELQS